MLVELGLVAVFSGPAIVLTGINVVAGMGLLGFGVLLMAGVGFMMYKHAEKVLRMYSNALHGVVCDTNQGILQGCCQLVLLQEWFEIRLVCRL